MKYYDDVYDDDFEWGADEEILEEDEGYDTPLPTRIFRAEQQHWEDSGEEAVPWFLLSFPSPGFIIGIILPVVIGLALFLSYVASSWSPSTAEETANQPAEGVAVVIPEAAALEETSEFVASPEAAAAPCEVSSLFPNKVLRWCNLISYYAKGQNLDPDLVAALVWLESGGNEVAYSKSGAVGLMQVMPKDGLAASFMCINGPCFHDRPSIIELQNPEFNIKYGTKMLARLLNKHGDVREALKSYGPMNVGYYYADKVLGLFNQYGQAP